MEPTEPAQKTLYSAGEIGSGYLETLFLFFAGIGELTQHKTDIAIWGKGIPLFNLAGTRRTNRAHVYPRPNSPRGTNVKRKDLTECSLCTEHYCLVSCLLFVF